MLGVVGTSGNSGTPSASGTTGLFGPASLVSFSQTSSSSSSAFLGSVYQPGSAGVWQFDLAGVLNPQGTLGAIPKQQVSEEQAAYETEQVSLALSHTEMGEFDEAREILNAVLVGNATNDVAVHALGFTEQAAGNYEQAEQYYRKAHVLDSTVGYEQDANNARTLMKSDDEVVERARAYLKTPEYREEGIRLLMAVTERNDAHTTARIELAEAFLDQGDGTNGLMQYNSAISNADSAKLQVIERNLAELVADAPTAPFVRQLLGKVYLKQERYEEALPTLRTAAENAEDPIPYHRDLAKAYVGVGRKRLERGDLAGAMQSFEQAKELHRDGYEVRMALAEGYIERAERMMQYRKYSEALSDYRAAADMLLNGGDPNLKDIAAQSAYALGRKLENARIEAGEEIDSEVLAYQIAYDLDGENTTYKKKLAETRYALGEQAEAAGEYQSAAQSYKKAYDLYEKNDTYKQKTIDMFNAYGDERLASLNYDDAIEAYREALMLDKLNSTTRTKLAAGYNARGLDHVDWERYYDAVKDFKEALRYDPDNATYQANYDQWKAWDI
jgi:tetratricopeptide (TPR) repeat protein